ncbi:hypothetical protein EWM64_g6014 [Hericium alpestre]|uniref:Uncharacterized protein n=1 Tax=Hericium alpestre TaxID=135208 RepID=A0A4Y9ZV17_9AGAM|nr:hypothetical protein EWM64_g6014 [Hericium alpestre]
MLGGIVFQMVTILVYTVLALEFFLRVFTDKPLRDVTASPEQMARASTAKRLTGTCDADVLDGAMIIGAMYTLNFLHPGFLLRDAISTSTEDASTADNVFAGATADKDEAGFSDSTSKIWKPVASAGAI